MWAGRQTAAPHGKRSDNGRSVEGAAPRSSWRRSGGDGGCAVMSTQQMWNFLMSEPQVVCQTCMGDVRLVYERSRAPAFA